MKAERLSEDWLPNAEERAFAESRGIRDVDDFVDAFRCYWCALPDGKAATKKNWGMTFRNFVRMKTDGAGSRTSGAAAPARRNAVVAGMVGSFGGGAGQATLWDAADPKPKRH